MTSRSRQAAYSMQGDYGTLQSRTPRAAFPWNNARDSGRPDTGRGGYPTCREWWNDSSVGLKKRVTEEVDEGLWLRLSAAMKLLGNSQATYQEEIIKRLVSPANLTISQGGEVYRGYGGNADMTTMNAISRIGATAGSAVASLGAFPAFDAMRQALPMVQSILLMAVYIMLPMILAFAAYEFSTLITLTFVVFALNFLTFWWELARWLDSWMITALYGSDTHSSLNMMGLQNTSDDIIMNLVMGTMFLVLPAVWLGALSWAGVSIGQVINAAIGKGVSTSQQAGQHAGGITNKLK